MRLINVKIVNYIQNLAQFYFAIVDRYKIFLVIKNT